jgi:hypothetical protein
MKHWYENNFVTGLAPVIQQTDDVQFVTYPDYDWDFRVGIWTRSFWLEGQLYQWENTNTTSSLPYFMKSLIIWNSEWYGEDILPTAQDLGASDGY